MSTYNWRNPREVDEITEMLTKELNHLKIDTQNAIEEIEEGWLSVVVDDIRGKLKEREMEKEKVIKRLNKKIERLAQLSFNFPHA